MTSGCVPRIVIVSFSNVVSATIAEVANAVGRVIWVVVAVFLLG
jgi:hypothetical protein